MKRKNDKLCIIGSAPSNAEAPYGDASYDIWAISGAVYSPAICAGFSVSDDNKWLGVLRADVLFEMHKRATWECKRERLAACGLPVVMLTKEAEIPWSMAYPIDAVALEVGEEFTSSIAYMMALAIYMGYEEIRVYGVNLLHETEYLAQRPAFKYYLAIARERGISVWAPEYTKLTVPAWRYGYDDIDTICAMLEDHKAKLEDDANKQKQAVEDARQVFFQYRGAATMCGQLIQELKGGLA
jgi:hypothetical protein